MHEDFINIANTIKNESLLKTEALFVANRKTCLAVFAEHFKTICAEIQNMQEKSKMSAISYLEYTMLYTNFANRQYLAEIFAYDDEHYLDVGLRTVGTYDITFLFVYFEELWEKLLIVRKRFPGQITSQEVTSFMLESLPDFYSYLINIARFAIADCVDTEPFVSIIKGDIFMICVGEYMAKTELVFIENKNKDAKELTDWFLEELDEVYMCGDYSCLDFSAKSFDYNNYCYANFRGSSLINASLEGAMLVGTCFRNAHMEGCHLDKASINEADFSNAILKNASFINAHGRLGLPDEQNWWHVGFLPVSFRNADLTDANFKGADLTGADFSGAVLTGADFTDAIIINAIFDDGNIPSGGRENSKDGMT